MRVVSRDEARAQGLKRYFTGVMCKHGHVAERLVSCSTCVECNRDSIARLRADPVKRAAYNRRVTDWRMTKYWSDAEFRSRDNARARAYHHFRVPEQRREAANRNYRKQRLRLEARLRYMLRSRFHMAVKNNAKSGSAVRDLGCTILEFKAYLESLFQPGMTWDNWSRTGWHIDHKRPLASFDLTVREQHLAACHYTNLQPLWAQDNWRKYTSVEEVP